MRNSHYAPLPDVPWAPPLSRAKLRAMRRAEFETRYMAVIAERIARDA